MDYFYGMDENRNSLYSIGHGEYIFCYMLYVIQTNAYKIKMSTCIMHLKVDGEEVSKGYVCYLLVPCKH